METWEEPAERAELLWRYIGLLRESPHNLLSPRGLEELPTRHVPECLSLARMLPPAPGTLLDVGSGGGLPGIVIAIARPDLQVALLEATTKKAQFLRDAAAELDLAIEVVNARAEEAVEPLAGRFDLVTARAVAPLPRLLDWTIPFLRPGGRLYAVKGERWPVELDEAAPRIAELGVEVLSVPGIAPGEDDPWHPRVVILGAPAEAGGSIGAQR